MKYFAIFKDSLREALDTKLIYFTLGLSVLIVLLIGSIRYRPLPAQEQFERMTNMMNFLFERLPQGPRYRIDNFEQTNPGAEPWEGNYRFVMVLELPDEKMVQEVKDKKAIPVNEVKRQFQDGFPWIDQVEATEIPSNNPRELHFQIVTTGTKVKDRLGWPHELQLFFGAVSVPLFYQPLSSHLEFITDDLIGGIGAGITMFLSTIITAFFIPNMLRKGTIDLLLSKPIHRTTLLIYKFLGGLLFMFLNTVVIMTGLWIVLGLQSGVWLHGLLVCIFVLTFQFSIFYSISTLMGVLTRSAIVAILVSVAAWLPLWGIGKIYQGIDQVRPEKLAKLFPNERVSPFPSWVYTTVDTVHFVLPRYKDLDVLTTRLIRKQLLDPDSKAYKTMEEEYKAIGWDTSIMITVIWIGALLGISCWWFAKRDY